MEITIRIEGLEAVVGVRGSAPAAAVDDMAPTEPPAAIASRATTLGAVNAGSANIPSGELGEPAVNVTTATGTHQEAAGAMAAGAAPGQATEPEPVVVEVQEGEQ